MGAEDNSSREGGCVPPGSDPVPPSPPRDSSVPAGGGDGASFLFREGTSSPTRDHSESRPGTQLLPPSAPFMPPLSRVPGSGPGPLTSGKKGQHCPDRDLLSHAASCPCVFEVAESNKMVSNSSLHTCENLAVRRCLERCTP